MSGTKAKTILNRDVARAQIAEVRDLCSPVLEHVIDNGVRIFERCSHTAQDGDENLGILFPFHHLLEMADGVHILLDDSAVAASHPLLRAMFEALLGIKYVLEENTDRRALAYVVADVKSRIRLYEQMDPATEIGKQFGAETGLRPEDGFPFPDVEKIREAKANLGQMLSRKPFVEIADQFDELRATRGRMPAWYAVDNGPRNLRELSRHLDELDNYDVLYRQWSKTTHALDLNRQLTAGTSGAAIKVIRSAMGIETRYTFAINFVLGASRLVLQHYRPGELDQQSRWYMEEISPELNRIEAIETVEGDD